MSEIKHTPGPWVAASHPSSIVGWPIVAQTGRLVCNLATPPKDINRVGKALAEYEAFIAECGANARLIAAAPELLEALIMALPYVESCEDDPAYKPMAVKLRVKMMRAAIAKAEGHF